jgi:hypothetical protein
VKALSRNISMYPITTAKQQGCDLPDLFGNGGIDRNVVGVFGDAVIWQCSDLLRRN